MEKDTYQNSSIAKYKVVFGNKLRLLRVKSGLTQPQLAELLQYSARA